MFFSDAEDMLTRATETVAAKFRDSKTTYVVETLSDFVTEEPQPVIIRNRELDLPTESNAKSLQCSHFCSKDSNKTHSAEVISGVTWVCVLKVIMRYFVI